MIVAGERLTLDPASNCGAWHRSAGALIGPAKGLESKQLPFLAGPFMMVSRLYIPEMAMLDGDWKEPPLQTAN